jgi:metal-responsive CopG/Arc/MetJ family transcriptional regulator
MKTRIKKTVTTALAQEELAELDRVRRQQGLTRAEAVRDAIRWYIGAIGRLPPAEDMSPEEAEAIRRGKDQIARGEYVRLEDLQHELGLPTK